MWQVWALSNRSSHADRVCTPPAGRPRRPLLLCALGIFALLSVVVGRSEPVGGETFSTDAVGRLIVDGNRLCTGFVIRSIPRQVPYRLGGHTIVYENWLATAGHCHGAQLTFQQGTRTYEVHVIGFSDAGSDSFDVMLMGFLTDKPFPTLEPAFGVRPQVGDPLMLIGYGSRALMMRVGPLVRYDERGRMEIHSYASRGNSGGPVLIPGTRLVVGIGVETTIDKPEGAALFYCVLAQCAPKPPYIAAPIDRLQGIASFH
jgi:hypothetical protein